MMTIREYRDLKMLSQSSLKLLDYSPAKFYEYEYMWLKGLGERRDMPENEAMRFGSLVDCKLLTPELFDETYSINSGVTPTGQMLTFVEAYYKFEFEYEALVGTKDLSEEEVLMIATKAYDAVGFKRDKLQSVIERFKTEGIDYYNFLLLSAGKKVISQEEDQKATKLIFEAKNAEFIGDILSADSSPGLVTFKQLPLFTKLSIGTYLIEVKGLLDFVIVDNLNKTITPYDLKTTGESYFLNSYTSRRYDLQAALYTELLKTWAESNYPDYQVLPFNFLVIYTNGNKPELYELTQDQLRLGAIGGTNQYGRPVKGFIDLLQDYVWHVENNKWNYSKEVYENNGRKLI